MSKALDLLVNGGLSGAYAALAMNVDHHTVATAACILYGIRFVVIGAKSAKDALDARRRR